MAASSKRVLWKGAISFGLVHIPIALHSATEDQALDFDWLDKRSMDPVGYKRINKRTGEDIDAENIVKGIAYEDGQYVILSPEEIQAAYPKTTQTIEIETFVPAESIPFLYFDRPYYISPINKANKVYALLREVLKTSGKVGIAKVVIQTKQHLALLAPSGPALVLNLLRWGSEIRTWDELNLPAEGATAAGVSAREMAMGTQLVDDMSSSWTPDAFTDVFKEQILQLVDAKVKAGDTEKVTALESEDSSEEGATVYDLTEILKRSLGQRTAAATGKSTPAKVVPVKTPAARPISSATANAVKKVAARKPATKIAAKVATKVGSKIGNKAVTKTVTPKRKAA